MGGAIAEAATLGGASGRVGLRIEVENDLLAAELRERALLSGVVGNSEIGSGVTNLKHGGLLGCRTGCRRGRGFGVLRIRCLADRRRGESGKEARAGKDPSHEGVLSHR